MEEKTTASEDLQKRLYVLEWPFSLPINYYFIGPDNNTDDEFDELCERLAIEVVHEYCGKEPKKFSGLYDMGSGLAKKLEGHGFKSFDPKLAIFRWGGGKHDTAIARMKKQLDRQNEKFSRKLIEEMEKEEEEDQVPRRKK